MLLYFATLTPRIVSHVPDCGVACVDRDGEYVLDWLSLQQISCPWDIVKFVHLPEEYQETFTILRSVKIVASDVF